MTQTVAVPEEPDAAAGEPDAVAVGEADAAEAEGEAAAPAALPWWHRHAAWVAAVGVTVLVTLPLWLLSAKQWAIYRAPSWDLGIFTQTVRAYSELRAPIVPIKGEGYLILGDHFHPLLAVLAPVYKVFPSGFTLLAVQAVAFGLAAGIVAYFAVRRLGWWGAAIGLASGWSFFLVEAQASQFHEIALAVPLVAMSMGMLVQRRGIAAVAWSLPLLAVKEDLGLTVAVIGVVVAIRARSSRERTWGVSSAVVGVLAFVVVTQWVLPALNPDGVWAYADDSIVSLLLSDPGAAFSRLVTGIDAKLAMLILPVLITGVVSVRSPLALVALPTLAWRFASDVSLHWGTSFHYGAILAPVMFLALVDALGSMRAADQAGANRRPWLIPVMSAGTLALAVILIPRFSLWTLTSPITEAERARAQVLAQAGEQIADGERVSMDITLMAYLAPRAEIYWIGNVNPTPDAVLLDRSSGVLADPPADLAGYAGVLHPDTEWVNVWDVDPVGIARPVP